LTNTKNIFFVGLVVAASGLISTPLALLAGLIYGMSFPHPYHLDAKKLSAFLLQASIVGLGFGMNLHEVVRAGRTGFLYTALSISFAMLLGLGIGHLFKVQRIPSLLISTGTAICGGSAIAPETVLLLTKYRVYTNNSVVLQFVCDTFHSCCSLLFASIPTRGTSSGTPSRAALPTSRYLP